MANYWKSTIWVAQDDPQIPLEICDYFHSREEARRANELGPAGDAFAGGAVVTGNALTEVRCGTRDWHLATKKLAPLIGMAIEARDVV